MIHQDVYLYAYDMGMPTTMKFALTCLRDELARRVLEVDKLESLVNDYGFFTNKFCNVNSTSSDEHQNLTALFASHIVIHRNKFESNRAYRNLHHATGSYLGVYTSSVQPDLHGYQLAMLRKELEHQPHNAVEYGNETQPGKPHRIDDSQGTGTMSHG
jgi:hypothetical protein